MYSMCHFTSMQSLDTTEDNKHCSHFFSSFFKKIRGCHADAVVNIIRHFRWLRSVDSPTQSISRIPKKINQTEIYTVFLAPMVLGNTSQKLNWAISQLCYLISLVSPSFTPYNEQKVSRLSSNIISEHQNHVQKVSGI